MHSSAGHNITLRHVPLESSSVSELEYLSRKRAQRSRGKAIYEEPLQQAEDGNP